MFASKLDVFLLLLLLLLNLLVVNFAESAVVAPCVTKPCKTEKNSIQFYLFGDWGGLQTIPYFTNEQHEVEKLMVHLADERGIPEFLLALGDNFYTKGVKDVKDLRFKETYQEVYRDKEMNVPWFVLAGNHDHYGNVSAQIAFSSKDERWNFPSLYYVINYQLGDGTKIRILMIDTVLLCGNTGDPNLKSFVDGSEGSEQPNGPENQFEALKHWNWIESRLKDATDYDYLLVAGHFPVYSISSHGPTQCLVDKLKPLLEKYEVSAYFCGHDHNLQHIQTISGKNSVLNFVVSGSGAFFDPSKKHFADVPLGSSKFFFASPKEISIEKGGKVGKGGIVVAEATKNSMEFIFYTDDKKKAQELYRFQVDSRLNANQSHSKVTRSDPKLLKVA